MQESPGRKDISQQHCGACARHVSRILITGICDYKVRLIAISFCLLIERESACNPCQPVLLSRVRLTHPGLSTSIHISKSTST